MTMLDPDTRHLYVEALEPPAGYELDRAIGTTYSLDLTTLLTLPLSFALLEAREGREALLKSPVALLHALRKHARSMTVFCEAGRISVPIQRHPLFAYLEQSVVEVRPEAGSFHPKTWLLRFTSEDEDAPVRYRFLCLSRNLTADRSWDTGLVVDGELVDRERAITQVHPLGDFVASLAPHGTPKLAADLLKLSQEVRRVRFETPEPFSELDFFPIGVEGRPGPTFPEAQRTLVVSPFLEDELLSELGGRDRDVLVSRRDSLDQLDAATRARFAEILVLRDDVEEAIEAESAGEAPGNVEATPSVAEAQRGLHAKLFVFERGHQVQLWTGSANATNRAFSGNTEFIVELRGTRKQGGIDAILGSAEKGLRRILEPYAPPSVPRPVDAEARRLENLLEAGRDALVRGQLKLVAKPTPGSEDRHDLALVVADALEGDALAALTARCWPVTLPAEQALDVRLLSETHPLVFERLTADNLSAFIAFELRVAEPADHPALRFVLNLDLEGFSGDRGLAALRAVLSDPTRVLTYLRLLLSRDDSDQAAALDPAGAVTREGTAAASVELAGFPVFEELLRTAARSPERLEGVKKLLDELRQTRDGARLLPAGFETLFDAVWRARGDT
jgi:hypothetical protein